MTDAGPTTVTRTVQRTVEMVGWPLRLGVSIAMGGFLMLMGVISFPLPWTPVPFSMMPFGLLVAGAVQKPGYAAGSVLLYLVAAGLGLPVFADGESGWSWFVGSTAGYLFGFFLTSLLVSFYMQRARRGMSPRWAMASLGIIAASVLAGIAAIIWMWTTGEGLAHLDSEVTASWGVGKSALWVLLFLFGMATVTVLWMLGRSRGEQSAALNLFVVMFGAILVLHAVGVTVLWLVSPLSLMGAIILGSIVFLPFDMVKAGLAVGLTQPFLKMEPHHE